MTRSRHEDHSLAEGLVEDMCRRAFGVLPEPGSVEILPVGTVNLAYRMVVAGEPVVLRVGPVGGTAMRNGYAANPYFAGLEDLVPRLRYADFTGQIGGREYTFADLHSGEPAWTALERYTDLTPYWRQLGSILRRIHEVRGPWFGQPGGPGYPTWADALAAQFREYLDGYPRAGLDPAPVQRALDAVEAGRDELSAVAEPRLLHSDLWRNNILLDPDADEPTITGVLDFDMATFGDPYADWTFHQMSRRDEATADVFWSAYGQRPVMRRCYLYEARARMGDRLDIHRRGMDVTKIPPVHWDPTEPLDAYDRMGS